MLTYPTPERSELDGLGIDYDAESHPFIHTNAGAPLNVFIAMMYVLMTLSICWLIGVPVVYVYAPFGIVLTGGSALYLLALWGVFLGGLVFAKCRSMKNHRE